MSPLSPEEPQYDSRAWSNHAWGCSRLSISEQGRLGARGYDARLAMIDATPRCAGRRGAQWRLACAGRAALKGGKGYGNPMVFISLLSLALQLLRLWKEWSEEQR